MKTALRMFIVLTLIGGISGGVLSAIDSITKPYIEAHRLEALKNAIADVIPEYDYYNTRSDGLNTFYVGMKKDSSEPVGIAFRITGSGFQGNISMMIGVSNDFKKITGLKILEQVETPGLGTKIMEDPNNADDPFWFSNQFIGLSVAQMIRVIKNVKPTGNNEIQAISGATISSMAVTNLLNQNLKKRINGYPNSTLVD